MLGTRWGVLAAAGTSSYLQGRADGVTRAQQRLPWPSILGWLGRPAADPHGRYVALAFVAPTWYALGIPQGQVLDVWLLETKTGKLTQLP